MTEEVREKIRKVVDYFRYHNKNLTGTQDLVLYELEDALEKQKESGLKERLILIVRAAKTHATKIRNGVFRSSITALTVERK